MRSKVFRQLLRGLLYATGAGAGLAAAFLCVQVHDMTNDDPLALWLLILLYAGMGALGVLTAHLTAPKLVAWWADVMAVLEKTMESLTTTQLVSMVIWLMGGLLIASLLTQVLHFLGESIFTMSVSAILYVVLGVMGLSIGARRAEDMASLMAEGRVRKAGKKSPPKFVDASALMDGRIAAVARTGIIEGEIVTADFILAELTDTASSADSSRRLRAQRGLDAAKLMGIKTESTGISAPAESDVALMSIVREKNAALITADALMHKAARVAGIPVININDLAVALRTVTSAGDVLSVRLTKTGKEPHQGVGYLDDGTMVVVENAGELIGREVTVTITSVLQTSAGRMIFTKKKTPDEKAG